MELKKELCNIAAELLKIAAESDRQKGKWKDIYYGQGTCSECDRRNVADNFCPNCGADMRGETNE